MGNRWGEREEETEKQIAEIHCVFNQHRWPKVLWATKQRGGQAGELVV